MCAWLNHLGLLVVGLGGQHFVVQLQRVLPVLRVGGRALDAVGSGMGVGSSSAKILNISTGESCGNVLMKQLKFDKEDTH